MFENDLESRNQARWNGFYVGWDQYLSSKQSMWKEGGKTIHNKGHFKMSFLRLQISQKSNKMFSRISDLA